LGSTAAVRRSCSNQLPLIMREHITAQGEEIH
jgi:hypothetical protein